MQKGDFVVLVNDHWPHQQDRRRGVCYPVKGPVYTVRDVRPSPISDGVVVALEEIINPPIFYKHNGISLGRLERMFGANRFRKLDPKALDVFRAETVEA